MAILSPIQSAPGAASLTAIHTAAAPLVISTANVCNRSATPTAFRIAISPGGAAIADQHYVAYDVAIGANEVIPLTNGYTMATGDVLRVYNTLATLSFNFFPIDNT